MTHLRSTLMLARQSAIMNGKSTYVIFNQQEPFDQSKARTNTWYIVCREEGTTTHPSSGKVMWDEYATWSTNEVKPGGLIYNLDTGESSRIEEITPTYIPSLKTEIYSVTTEKSIWSTGVKYGWEIQQKTYLPRGYQFGSDDPPTKFTKIFVFNADGSAFEEYDDYDLYIYETIRPGQSDPHTKVSIAELTGFVTIQFIK